MGNAGTGWYPLAPRAAQDAGGPWPPTPGRQAGRQGGRPVTLAVAGDGHAGPRAARDYGIAPCATAVVEHGHRALVRPAACGRRRASRRAPAAGVLAAPGAACLAAGLPATSGCAGGGAAAGLPACRRLSPHAAGGGGLGGGGGGARGKVSVPAFCFRGGGGGGPARPAACGWGFGGLMASPLHAGPCEWVRGSLPSTVSTRPGPPGRPSFVPCCIVS